MNTVLILFLVAVIIISIFMVAKYYNPDYLIRKSKSLFMKSSRESIPADSLDLPGSSRYYYECWLYINGNSPIYSANVLFNRGNDLVVTLIGSTLNIYVNVKGEGKGEGVNETTGVLDLTGLTPLTSISDFPFQKWTQLVIYVDGSSMDVYLDGKLIKNVKNNTAISVTPSDNITYGNKFTDGQITRFRRPAESINPQKVWNSFMMGSGENRSASDYHLTAEITKNKKKRAEQQLF
jgi:hypothetical protein